jgi:hypothetical protein
VRGVKEPSGGAGQGNYVLQINTGKKSPSALVCIINCRQTSASVAARGRGGDVADAKLFNEPCNVR